MRRDPGVPPPNDLHAERGVLARALEGDRTLIDRLRAEHFYSRGHAEIYAAIGAVLDLRRRIEIDSVARLLRAGRVHYIHSVDVSDYLTEIVGEHAWGLAIEQYAVRVIAAWRARVTALRLEDAAARVRTGDDPDLTIAALLVDLGRAA